MSQLLLPLATAILGALFGLLAGTTGPLVRSRRAHMDWLRNMRGRLCDTFYQELLQACDDVRAWQDFGYIPDKASARQLAEAAGVLELYCSEEVSDAARSVVQKYSRWLIWDPANEDTLAVTVEQLMRRSQEFLEEAEEVKHSIHAELANDVTMTADNSVDAL